MNNLSLNQRIVTGAILILIFFITLTAAALNKAFVKSSENALKDTLTTQLYALIATAEVDIVNDKPIFNMPNDDLATLLGLPNSGLYAQVISSNNTIIWQSESYISSSAPKASFLEGGKQVFTKLNFNHQQFYQLAYGINWLIGDRELPFTFIINQDLKAYNQQLNDYSNTLWLWLGGMAVFLILSQIIILKWGLSPINQVVDELQNIEAGHQEKIEQIYPKEIEYLSNNINHLLENEHAQKKRYRNALGDLAHSLKTPLAVLQSSIKNNQVAFDQIKQMNSIVEYQLQKAATAGANNLSLAINISVLLNRIIDSLQKVYREKELEILFLNNDDIFFKADEGDMMELFGNLLDNAFKWASSRITIDACLKDKSFFISIIDDGSGFPPDLIERVTIRGQRADESTPGHGIGLSIVNTIIDSYGGKIDIKNNYPTQGSCITIKL